MIDLDGPQRSLQFANNAWRDLLELAKQHGWSPARPSKPDSDEKVEVTPLTPIFRVNEGQVLSEEEARRSFPEVVEVARSQYPKDPELTTYCVSDGREVSADDALEMANALARALPSLPASDAVPNSHRGRHVPAGTKVRVTESSRPLRALVKEFIAFAREGGFEIW